MAIRAVLRHTGTSVAWALGTVFAHAAYAQAPDDPAALSSRSAPSAELAGQLRGTVRDAATTTALEGARVSLPSLGLRTVTERNGVFVFDDVPQGQYAVNVEYLGLPSQGQTVTISAGQTTQLAITLGAVADSLEQVVVVGRVTETAKKLNQERAATALTEIASSDTSNEFPDRNLGEVLQRLTGVFVDRNGTGEGNILLVRGVSPVNNLVLVEGVRLPSGRGDGRTPNLATINSDLIERVEVRKVFTPEIPGDFFGAYVDVKQPSAFDRQDTFLGLSLESARRSITNHGIDYEGAFRGSTQLAEDRIGISFSLAGGKRDGSFHQYNVARSPNNLTGATTAPATFPTSFQTREVDATIERIGGNVNFEFRPADSSRYYLKTFANWGEELGDDLRVNLLFGPSPTAGSTALAGAYPAYFPELETITVSRPERFVNYVAGGENSLDAWKLSYSVAYNELSASQRDSLRFASRSPVARAGAQYNLGDPDTPIVTVANPGLLADPATFGPAVAPSTNLSQTDEDQRIAQANISRAFAISDSELLAQVGARYDVRRRSQNAGGVQNYAPFPTSAQFIEAGEQDLFRGRFDPPVVLNPDALTAAFVTPASDRPPGDINYLASIAGDFSGEEKISAAYAMATWTKGTLQIVGGARFEQTDTDGTNVAINRAIFNPMDADPLDADPSDGVAPSQLSARYDQWLPSLVLRYEPTERTLLRLGASKTYARPTLAQIFGGETVALTAPGSVNRAVTRGNEGLVPQEAWNLDASVDFYGGSASVLRLGVFHKEISEVFFTAATTAPNTLGGTDFISQPQNGGDARLSGVEAGIVQGLTFLPGPLNRLSVELNAAYAWSDQDVLGTDGSVIRQTDLEGSYDFIANVSLIYRIPRLTARLAYLYNGERLNTIDINPNGGFNDAFRDRSKNLDADLSFRLSDNVSVSIEARNILDNVEVFEYIGADRDSVTRAQYSGRSIGVGISAQL